MRTTAKYRSHGIKFERQVAREFIAEHLPHFIEQVCNRRRLQSALGYLSPQQFEDQHIRQLASSSLMSVHSKAHSSHRAKFAWSVLGPAAEQLQLGPSLK